MLDFAYALFAIDVVILFVLLTGTIWSVVRPDGRIWPPPRRRSWQYVVAWVCLYAVVGLNAAVLFLDWNQWIFRSNIRFVVGIPLMLLGGLLALWGVITLSWTNTSGLKGGFISAGPTRNPQYVGDIMFFVGAGIVANSALLWSANALLILVFVIAPLTEEPWLKDQYGQVYHEYRRDIPRFL